MPLGDGRAVAELHAPGILGNAVYPKLVMEMGTAGQSGGSDVPDRLALGHPGPAANPAGESAKMTVPRRDAVAVPKLDEVAVAACSARAHHDAVPRRHHRGA